MNAYIGVLITMRIAICISHLGGGGAERTRLMAAQGLIARGHEVDLLLLK